MSDTPLEIRPAWPADLPAAAHIKSSGDAASGLRGHPFLAHEEPDLAEMTVRSLAMLTSLQEENPEQVWVASVNGAVAGMAAVAIRGRHGHIVAYFVDPAQQQRGLGGPLFTSLLDACRRHGCDVLTLQTSDDPRAMTHYFRNGFRPTLPQILWATETLTPASDIDVSHLQAEPINDEAMLRTAGDIDKAVREVRRPEDLRRWTTDGMGLLILDRLSGIPRGYAILREDPDAVRIGPLAANDVADVSAILHVALQQAAVRKATSWRVALPAENVAAVPVLLAWGFRPVWNIAAMATGEIGQFDRYVFHNLNIL